MLPFNIKCIYIRLDIIKHMYVSLKAHCSSIQSKFYNFTGFEWTMKTDNWPILSLSEFRFHSKHTKVFFLSKDSTLKRNYLIISWNITGWYTPVPWRFKLCCRIVDYWKAILSDPNQYIYLPHGHQNIYLETYYYPTFSFFVEFF
jgi:hypothetical protein